MSVEPHIETQSLSESSRRDIVGAATILAAGNALSRLLGLGRELVIADLFGATGYVSVFRVASSLVITLYDFFVGGLISAALVPVFSEYAADKARRHEFWKLVSATLSVIAALLAVAVLLLELFAEPLFEILGAGYNAELRAAGVRMIRWILPAVFFLGVAGVLSGILYALKKFTLPAFITAIFNLSIIVCGIALAPTWGILSIVIGIVVGAASQVILQFIELRRTSPQLRLEFSRTWLAHPALKQIGKLYVPVLGGLAVMLVGVALDRNLASRAGEQALAWMQAATYLVQLPLGLVVTAISFAILPNLARAVSALDFRRMLALGLKLALLLMLPCVVTLFVLATPVVTLLYQHGAFTAEDTAATARALRFYLLGTTFAAIDQPLVFAFYARKNTLLPNLVAVAALGFYLVVALPLLGAFGYLALVLANSAQLAGHALLMVWFTRTRLGGLAGEGLGVTTLKALLASALMGLAMFVLPMIELGSGLVQEILRVALPTAIGAAVYIAALKILRVREADQIFILARQRLRRAK
ncbi:MAG: murein biosynthesis integral membrane protein MurJ [Chloroflexi bacterium UTCFX4]|jgi:putative peptidoglycan lipid II flippase|nr:MAG: murein biosynthesis integral membrane protein MurJ [Chloroflexi bacterium UTCFX4]